MTRPNANETAQSVEIVRWDEIGSIEDAYDHLVRIFFETSNTKAFASESARKQFLQRWLSRYLMLYPEHAFVARNTSTRVPVGYLIASLDDPAKEPIFSDLPFVDVFAETSAIYPAHLHVNVTADHQSKGIGKALIDAFINHAREQGCPGAHVVTSKDARNVAFYNANGFEEKNQARIGASDSPLVVLARAI